MKDAKVRIDKALDIAWQSPHTDGAHHKQWLIDQMVKALIGDDLTYQMWTSFYNQAGEWDHGITP